MVLNHQNKIITDFVTLANELLNRKDNWGEWARLAKIYNPWFTELNVAYALSSIIDMLQVDNLNALLEGIKFEQKGKKIGVVMAGNLPLVGFHDFMCILLSGNQVYAKLSTQDPVLLKIVSDILFEIAPELKERVYFVEKLNGMDAVIATGSDNSAKYFNYYFSSIPHIIRKNRTSLAVLNGEETREELEELGNDIFTYYGLGCRNISKIYLPAGFPINKFFEAIEKFHDVGNHNKYQNNYSYNKSVYLINSITHLDNGFLLLTESTELVSPLGVLFYEYYSSLQELENNLLLWKDKIQVITSRQGWFPGSIKLGKAQRPEVGDFADGVNTLEFLAKM